MKGLTLVLDGSTYSASVALLRDGVLIAQSQLDARKDGESGGRGEALVPLIAELLAANGARPGGIAAVICGAGPGSFTSLRVAASVAKGIAFASGARMYAVSSLLLTIAGTRDALDDGNYLSVLPAMRGEMFALGASVIGGKATATGDGRSILNDESVRGIADSLNARVIGPGQEIEGAPHARGAARLLEAIIGTGPVDLPSWEPDYGRLAEAQVRWEADHGRPLRG